MTIKFRRFESYLMAGVRFSAEMPVVLEYRSNLLAVAVAVSVPVGASAIAFRISQFALCHPPRGVRTQNNRNCILWHISVVFIAHSPAAPSRVDQLIPVDDSQTDIRCTIANKWKLNSTRTKSKPTTTDILHTTNAKHAMQYAASARVIS